MTCIKCSCELPPNAVFCHMCGKKQTATAQTSKKRRGNGTGSAYKRGNKWVAAVTLGYKVENGKTLRVVEKKAGFKTKKEALEYIPVLRGQKKRKKAITLQQAYNLWFPTHRAGKSTLGNYRAAFKYFASISYMKIADIEIEDYQECVDECPKGKATKTNMKTVIGLIYKYAIPRGYLPEKLNLADYIIVTGDPGAGGTALPANYVDKIREDSKLNLDAQYVIAQCYLGFRPSEFLALQVSDYDRENKLFVGGAKTDAGKNRTVPVSKSIQHIIDVQIGNRESGQVFCRLDGSEQSLPEYRQMFYDLLDRLNLENPIITVSGRSRHTYTPHSCRHTFATMLKSVPAPDKDKMSIIGHSSVEMLHYYQEADIDGLRAIVDSFQRVQ